MKDADGIILATTVEWLGIGGFMYQFLDACWLYGDKEKDSVSLYAARRYVNHLWRTRGHDFVQKTHGKCSVVFLATDSADMSKIWSLLK